MQPDELLDLKGVPCPENAARALLKLQLMAADEVLELVLDDGEPLENVPQALEMEGHKIYGKEKLPSGHWRLLVEVG